MPNDKELHQVTPEPVFALDEEEILSDTDPQHHAHHHHHPHDSPQKKPISQWLIPILYRMQKYSAYTFVSFLGIHITSVVIVPIIPVDKEVKQQIFSLAKAVYQDVPFFEPIAIFGASLVHVIAGLGLRLVRGYKKHQIYKKLEQKREKHKEGRVGGGRGGGSSRGVAIANNNDSFNIRDDDDDIGFGGLSNIFGLGYRKSFISKFLGITPLQFSGYLLIPVIAYHFYKFKYVPMAIEGDSSLINLDYISFVLNLKHPKFQSLALTSLVWIMSYHVTNGVMKLNSWFSQKCKRIGLAIVNVVGVCGMVAVYLFKKEEIDSGDFLGKVFTKYINSFLL
ncbi:hypothetical protein FOB58_005671 [Candida parapsilosis]|uniref:Mitochondrial adapter protein MCP1 transmembrane domain-containing protein n=2 Tax=Candida parapsilosis TaxID=5480 RepID=G8BKH2_CANPC|nr:uncharacterized protein CPAR2_702500 [Candida parapsilosis]KAF6042188.1 hypothetical protein FOB58_005671 [Candida parapsilosis]KAF6042467.1 hypothetical protein FOB59_005649 [Candida parapsilosis]KAF6042912.1 hypothetical protein FOB60_005666 [Candida parapsilosis]KAF6058079.1 hypothetical protein FOB61_005668 [Candida parapsilosis]KAI5903175.1 hypothetical protein K4G60_g2330 [Candida parapsilosis]